MLFCNTLQNTQVARDKVYQSIAALAGEANIADSMSKLIGDMLDDRLGLQFLAGFHTAAACCSQLFSSSQFGKGKRKEQSVEDAQGNELQYFVSPDE